MVYGEAVRGTGALPGCSPRAPPTYQERILKGLPRAREREDPGPRSASPSRVPGLSRLLLLLTAGATSKGCGYLGAECRSGRWGEVGRGGHRGLDVGKHFPTSAKGRHGGTKKISLFRAFGTHTPLRRGRGMVQMTSRALPPSGLPSVLRSPKPVPPTQLQVHLPGGRVVESAVGKA